ncbi:MAG: Rho termination factor N-terminal domain-containing protein, partial [Pyrinomonadaceae bacterium]
MATKTTQPRRTKSSKAADDSVALPAEDVESSNGEVREKKSSGSNGGAESAMLNIADLKDMSISELTHIAKEMGIEGATGLRKQELIFKVLADQTEKSGL